LDWGSINTLLRSVVQWCPCINSRLTVNLHVGR
jgi:hypothetical protein